MHKHIAENGRAREYGRRIVETRETFQTSGSCRTKQPKSIVCCRIREAVDARVEGTEASCIKIG